MNEKKIQIKFSLIALFTLVNCISFYQPVTANSYIHANKNLDNRITQTEKKRKQGSGSKRGRPTKRKGMGSRNDCPVSKIPVTALIPENKISKVVEEKPTFWLFIPYNSDKISTGEFIIQDEAHNDIYRTDFIIKKGEGIVSISLADGKTLETDEIYQWYFKLYCDRDKSSIPIYVRGLVERVKLQPRQQNQLNAATSPSQRFDFYSQNNIWYSALTELVKLRQSNPRNKIVFKDWLQLLKGIELQELSEKPILGKVD